MNGMNVVKIRKIKRQMTGILLMATIETTEGLMEIIEVAMKTDALNLIKTVVPVEATPAAVVIPANMSSIVSKIAKNRS
jgi:hypothetical protein